jgi:acetyltransferase
VSDAFEALFNPRGVAIVGASGDLTRFGGQTVRALNRSGFAGGIYPVNPKYAHIDERPCYPSVAQIPGDCDLAVIALPAAHAARAVRECGERGIRYAVILGGGFREIGEAGARLEGEMLAAAREHNVRLVGPNCIGLVNVHARMIAAFGSMTRPPALQPGAVSAVLQSGGFGMSVVIQCAMRGIGFRYVVASGGETDITTPELIDAYVADRETRVILAYIEGVADGRALMAALRRARDAGKPVVVWKGGKTGQGARAAASHTANLTSTYDVYKAALRQCGAVEVSETEHAVDFLEAFLAGRLPAGRNVAAVTNTGGSAVVFCDAADEALLKLDPLAGETSASLRALLPPLSSVVNPVDTTAGYPRPEHAEDFQSAFEVLLADPGIDQVCVLFGTIMGETFELQARVLCAAVKATAKPVFAFSAIPKAVSSQGWALLEEARIPVFATPARAARAMGLLADYAQALQRRTLHTPARLSALDLPSFPDGAVTLDEHESKQMLERAGIAVTRDVLLSTTPDLEDMRGVVFPAAVKVVSRDIPHKTEIGGVRLDVRDASAVRDVAAGMLARARRAVPHSTLRGVLVCEMITDGIETLVGVVNDNTFGPVVAFGFGGVFAESLRDMSYRVAPFGIDEARDMIAALRGHARFEGVRGAPASDTDALAQTLVRVSELAWAWRERLAELDINPLLVRPKGSGVVAADALIVLRQSRRAPR